MPSDTAVRPEHDDAFPAETDAGAYAGSQRYIIRRKKVEEVGKDSLDDDPPAPPDADGDCGEESSGEGIQMGTGERRNTDPGRDLRAAEHPVSYGRAPAKRSAGEFGRDHRCVSQSRAD